MNRNLAVTALLALARSIASGQTAHHPGLSANVARQVAKVHAANSDSAHRNASAPNWNSLAQYRTPDWFRDAKFGIFLHWGVYSVPAFGNEWYSRNMYVPGNAAFEHHVATYGPQTKFGYKDFIPMFRAEHFDPNAWVDLFARAGAQYVVPVAEHCDGFAMYDSDMTTWNAAQMGPHRDVVGELETATRARGLHFGVSSHRAEHWWWYGVGRTFPSDVQDPANAGLYGPADADGAAQRRRQVRPTKEPDPIAPRTLAAAQPGLPRRLAGAQHRARRQVPPRLLLLRLVDRPARVQARRCSSSPPTTTTSRPNGTSSPSSPTKKRPCPPTPRRSTSSAASSTPCACCPGRPTPPSRIHSWGYVEHDEYRTAKSLIQQLVDTVSKNGNLLLNVGPKSDGTIPDEARTVLLQIGDWLRINGEAIYDTRPFTVFGEGPTKAPNNSTEKNKDIQTYTAEDIRFTTPKNRSDIVYAIAMGWPTTGELTIHTLYAGNPYLAAPVCSVNLLGSPQAIPFQQHPDGLRLTLPATKPNDSAYVFRVQTGGCKGAAR